VELDTEPRHALIGHSLNVSTLEYSVKRQKLISGSWDKTARIWSTSTPDEEWRCEMVLEEHEEAVWGVLAIDNGSNDGCWLTSSGRHPFLSVDEGADEISGSRDIPLERRGGFVETIQRVSGTC
jgi:WD40 repeat protein